VAVMAEWIDSLGGTPTEPPPAIVPEGGTFAGWVSVTLVPPDTNATLYYTLDGTLPTTNSLLYTEPFVVRSNLQVNANAFETGFVNSVASQAQFIITTNLLFSSPVYSGGAFQAQFSAATGYTYVLQASTDFVNWVSVSTNVPSTTPFQLSDPGAANFRSRFYRVLQLP